MAVSSLELAVGYYSLLNPVDTTTDSSNTTGKASPTSVETASGDKFTKVGPPPAKGDILDSPDLLWCEDDWNENREAAARNIVNNDSKLVPSFWRDKYEREASKNWDKFYTRNKTNFYKDRHYLQVAFPELMQQQDDNKKVVMAEVGCGVGNAVFPLLEENCNLFVYALDFSSTAIDFVKKRAEQVPNRVFAQVYDMTKMPLPQEARDQGLDLAMMLFSLSAVHPSLMVDAVRRVVEGLKPGGKLLFRDYGRYDAAQLRFKPGAHKLEDNFYVRGDGTRAFYFDLDGLRDLFTSAGLVEEECEYIRRQYANRALAQARYRVWVQAKFRKPME